MSEKIPGEKKIPTEAKIETAIKAQAKKWSTRSGMSSYSWATEVVSVLGFGSAPADIYRQVRRMVEDKLLHTAYLKQTTVCGSTALSVKAGSF